MRSIDLSKCPPILKQLIEQQGSATKAAKAIKSGVYTINRMARGILPMSDKMAEKIAAGVNGAASTKAPEPEATIPPWNGKVAPYSYITRDGKKQTVKKMPADFALILKRERGVLNTAAKAIGYSGWTTVRNIIEGGKYEEKLHANVYRVLSGFPIKPNNRNGTAPSGNDEMDKHKTGFVVCVVSLAEMERLEELASVMHGERVFRMASGAGTIVMYHIADRSKRETFKRLAQRDAKKIVCP